MSPHCRIGRVRMKGGADVHILEGGPHSERTDLRNSLARNVEALGDYFPDMAGYYVMVWDFSPNFNRAWRLHPRSPVSMRVATAYVGEVMRDDLTNSHVIENFGLDPL